MLRASVLLRTIVCVCHVLVFSGISFSGLGILNLSGPSGSPLSQINISFRMYVVLSAEFVRSPRQTLRDFSGHPVGTGVLGSEAFLLGTCPAG